MSTDSLLWFYNFSIYPLIYLNSWHTEMNFTTKVYLNIFNIKEVLTGLVGLIDIF